VSEREYALTALASVVGSAGALLWALLEHPLVAAACLLVSGWCTWRVFRYDLGER
jgi:hypothetical protein